MRCYVKIVMKNLAFVIIFFVGVAQNSEADLFAAGLKDVATEKVFIEMFLEDLKIDMKKFNSNKPENFKFIKGTHDTYKFKSGGSKKVTIHVVIDDLLNHKVDAVVNAANAELRGGGGIDKLIKEAAEEHFGKGIDVVKKYWKSGKPDDWDENDKKNTAGKSFFNTELLLKYKGRDNINVIQAVAPICSDYKDTSYQKKLTQAYYGSLSEAEKNNKKSIAFPLLGAGVFGCDSEECFLAAAQGIFQYFVDNPQSIIENVYINIWWENSRADLEFRMWPGYLVQDGGGVVCKWAKSVGGDCGRLNAAKERIKLDEKEYKVKLAVREDGSTEAFIE